MQISLREPGSSLTHLAAMFLTAGAGLPLLLKAADFGKIYVLAMLIFVVSMILLYGASAFYHAITLSPQIIRIFRKIDHSMIFILIAGSYTPVCIIILNPTIGMSLLIAVWTLAFLGILLKLAWINCPRWLSSTIYIALGWSAILVMKPIYTTISHQAFIWLLTGGIIYTLGGIIYALKLENFNKKHPYFSSHVIFHLFVMAGSFCHFIFMYQYLL
ncbi:PAQR family membrane homeostasis protein TrhA [Butyrivibrio sp. LC3010]|uniref:PAQR family membrane homeostasis protein TrhA n=1 Tax=Butyrivibrio sp. LC3010 TaxID=1280680 RepID=UPI0003F89931|nr:hemolysin III family protein [Butyrivibrio sp. LC3010]